MPARITVGRIRDDNSVIMRAGFGGATRGLRDFRFQWNDAKL